MNKFKEQAMKVVFMVAACASVLAVFLICLFLFANGTSCHRKDRTSEVPSWNNLETIQR